MAKNENAVEVELFRYGRLLFGKVLSTPKKLIGIGEISSFMGFEIHSSNAPELYPSRLYLHGGEHDADNKVFFLGLDSEKDAVEAAEKFKFMVEEINVELMKDASAKFPLKIRTAESEKKFKDGVEKII